MTVGSVAKRRRRSTPPPTATVGASRGWAWALLQLGVVAVESFAILFLLAQPAFRPQHVAVSGTAHLTAAEVTAALDLPADRNIFFLGQGELQQRVRSLPWVRSATVTLALPDRVMVRVTEWKPSAILQVGEATYYLNDAGAVLDSATEARQLLVIDRPDLAGVRGGAHILSSDLLQMLQQLRAGFYPAFKISVMAFGLDQREVLTAQTDRGWPIIFGQMTTADDRATLEPKLAALRALTSRLDLTSAPIAYINLENPGAPAVQMRARR
jgi:cell division septal protein FtsQ